MDTGLTELIAEGACGPSEEASAHPSVERPWSRYYSGACGAEAPSPDCGIESFLRQCNAGRIDGMALDYFGARTSFRRMFRMIDRLAAALQAAGVRVGDVVSVCGLNTPEFVGLLYAVNKVGAVSNWLGLTSPVADLREQLSSTGSGLVFVAGPAYESIQEAAQGTPIKTIVTVPIERSMPLPMRLAYALTHRSAMRGAMSWGDFLRLARGRAPEAVDVAGDDLAVIEYTGGSTGVPKGVMLSNRNLNSYYVNFSKTNSCGLSGFSEGDRFLACVPLFLAFGASSSCHGPLSHGMELVLAPDPTPDALGKIILKRRPNHIVAGRVQIDGFVRAASVARRDLSFVRSIMYGGEAANGNWEQESARALRELRMSAPMLNGYGMTECSACILVATGGADEGLIPLANVDVRVSDPDDPRVELGYGEEGELCLSSDTVMMGYLDGEAATGEAVFELGGRRWLRTRDLATISPDGRVHITGRIKRIYHKLGPENVGVRVYPMRTEDCISQVTGVDKCAVVGVPDDRTAYRSVAYLVLGDRADAAAVRERVVDRCLADLPGSHVPDEYVIVSELPLTRAGKVDYRALERMTATGAEGRQK